MTPSCGVIYIVFGREAQAACVKSLQSLRRTNPGIPAVIVGDTPMRRYLVQRIHWPADIPVFNLTKPLRYAFMAGEVKPRLFDYSPYERTLYLDADTIIRGDLRPGFAMLEEIDFAVTPHAHPVEFYRGKGSPGRGPDELEKSIEENGLGDALYWNSGMFFWRKNKRTEDLFKVWLEEWNRYRAWDEQLALMRAAQRIPGLKMRILPLIWNSKKPKPGTVIHHNYGEGIAWRRNP